MFVHHHPGYRKTDRQLFQTGSVAPHMRITKPEWPGGHQAMECADRGVICRTVDVKELEVAHNCPIRLVFVDISTDPIVLGGRHVAKDTKYLQ